MITRNYKAMIFDSSKEQLTVDALSMEAPLKILINHVPFSITMRSPGEDERLIRGLLHSEGVIAKLSAKITITEQETDESYLTSYNVEVAASHLKDGYSNSRSLLSVASCGICGKTELDDLRDDESLKTDDKIDPADLKGMFDQLAETQKTFKSSGGSHAAAAFDKNNQMLCAFEDIGRHNAVDKVIGELILSGRFGTAKTLLVSGRTSYEIVVKCFKARIPILASVSASSTLAVDFAKEFGITLFSFCRDNRATCYANIHRITKLDEHKTV